MELNSEWEALNGKFTERQTMDGHCGQLMFLELVKSELQQWLQESEGL